MIATDLQYIFLYALDIHKTIKNFKSQKGKKINDYAAP